MLLLQETLLSPLKDPYLELFYFSPNSAVVAKEKLINGVKKETNFWLLWLVAEVSPKHNVRRANFHTSQDRTFEYVHTTGT